MEKKKLLLVAISVGVFLALTIGSAILVFTPRNTNLPFETVTSNANPGTITLVPPSFYQPSTGVSEPPPSSFDVVELARNPGEVPGLVTSPANSQANETGRGTENVISVTQPSTAAVPNTAPTGRAVNQSAPVAATRPAQTTTTPATTATSAQTTTPPATTAARPAQTSTSPSQTPARAATTTPAASTPAQTASRPSASTPTQTTQVQPTPVASAGNSTPARIYDDFWVQTGAFSTVASAEWVKEILASRGITSIIENRIIDGRNLFRVRVGPYTSQNEANYWLALIQSMDGFEDSQVRQTQNLR